MRDTSIKTRLGILRRKKYCEVFTSTTINKNRNLSCKKSMAKRGYQKYKNWLSWL